MEGEQKPPKRKRVRGRQMGENPDWDGMVKNCAAVGNQMLTPRDHGTVGAVKLGRDSYLFRCLASLHLPPVHPHQHVINQ